MQPSIRATLSSRPAVLAARLQEPAGSPGKVDDLAGLAREASRPGAQPPALQPALPHPPPPAAHRVGAHLHLHPPNCPNLPPVCPLKPQLGSLNAIIGRDKRGAGPPSHMFFVLSCAFITSSRRQICFPTNWTTPTPPLSPSSFLLPSPHIHFICFLLYDIQRVQ